MRGIPGSGKTIVANKLIEKGGIIHTPGVHFFNSEVFELYESQGKVNYNPKEVKAIREKTYNAFCDSIKEGKEVIVLDDSNITSEEYSKFLKAARDGGYLVSIVDMMQPELKDATKNNAYGIKEPILRDMMDKWEPFIHNKLKE